MPELVGKDGRPIKLDPKAEQYLSAESGAGAVLTMRVRSNPWDLEDMTLVVGPGKWIIMPLATWQTMVKSRMREETMAGMSQRTKPATGKLDA